jgi:cyclic pyranopterin phosphate synthase
VISLPVVQQGNTSSAPPAAPDHAVRADRLIDSHGRTIRDVRVSVTDRCNFRCVYCMDPDFRYMPKQELLSLDEYVAIARVLVSLGVTKIRITGGEPTLYPQLDDLIARFAALGVPDLSMTTNGSLVTLDKAMKWKSLGLKRLTLSLDSLRDERVKAISRSDTSVAKVIGAIRIAQQAGLGPVKVNAVVMRGVNDDELPDFADFAVEHGIDYRLIEFMPLDSHHAWSMDRVFSAREMRHRIESRHRLVREEDDDPSSTSMNFRIERTQMGLPPVPRLPGASRPTGRIGLIAPVTQPFCGACSRLRITADGKVRPCLFSHDEWDLRAVLRTKSPTVERDVARFLIDSTWTKQKGHGIGSKEFHQPARTMSAIGG